MRRAQVAVALSDRCDLYMAFSDTEFVDSLGGKNESSNKHSHCSKEESCDEDCNLGMEGDIEILTSDLDSSPTTNLRT